MPLQTWALRVRTYILEIHNASNAHASEIKSLVSHQSQPDATPGLGAIGFIPIRGPITGEPAGIYLYRPHGVSVVRAYRRGGGGIYLWREPVERGEEAYLYTRSVRVEKPAPQLPQQLDQKLAQQ
eukprot:172856-Pyramimonas_sp.AAC.1